MRPHYLLTTHRHPEQIYRLADRLRRYSPTCAIVVSHDKKSDPLDVTRLSGAAYRTTPTPVRWGEGTLLRSMLAALGDLHLSDDDWVTVLTGQDYLLRPLTEYEEHLATCGADSLLEQSVWEDPDVDIILARYRSRAFTVPGWADRGAAHRLVNHIPGVEWHDRPAGVPSMLQVRRLRTPFDDGFSLTMGADQFALNGRALGALVRTVERRPELVRYYYRTRHAAESFFHTVLLNEAGITNRAEELHYKIWRSSAHPEYLTLADLPDMLSSGRWFARKFNPDDPVLDALDERLEMGVQRPRRSTLP